MFRRNPAVENQAVDRIVRCLLPPLLRTLLIKPIVASPGANAACHNCKVNNREFYRGSASGSTEEED